MVSSGASHRRPPLERVAFLLCGGLGTRIRGMTGEPKATTNVAGWPFLRFHLEALRDAGLERIVFLTGHRGDRVKEVFGPPSRERVFVREEAPRGTAGALVGARRWAGEVNWIANGDSYTDLLPRDLLAGFRPDGPRIVCVETADRSEYGGVSLAAEGRVEGFLEKGLGGPGWINAGIYLFGRDDLLRIPEDAASLEREVLPVWAEEGRLRAIPVAAFFRDIGTPERLDAAQREFLAVRERLEARRGGGAR